MGRQEEYVKETREKAAQSIATALEFLRQEAEAAGLPELSALIRKASSEAKHAGGSNEARADVIALPDACKAIGRLPAEYRKALVMRKVYRQSFEQIATDCNVSVATAKERIIKGFQLVQNSLRRERA